MFLLYITGLYIEFLHLDEIISKKISKATKILFAFIPTLKKWGFPAHICKILFEKEN